MKAGALEYLDTRKYVCLQGLLTAPVEGSGKVLFRFRLKTGLGATVILKMFIHLFKTSHLISMTTTI